MKSKLIGKLLRINLTNKNVKTEVIEEKVLRYYFGGSALACYFLLKELKPGVDPLGEENILVFSTSILTGIPVAGFSRFTVAGKSPLTNGFGEAEAGGWFGPELRKAGFDTLIIKGKSENPVYLWIHDGEVDFKDATHLVGKTIGESEMIICRELGDKNIKIAQIGPAGERLIRYSCIINNAKHANGRTGLGAVMGSKNLRAIAVRGFKRVFAKDWDKVNHFAKVFINDWGESLKNSQLHIDGTAGVVEGLNRTGILPTRNFIDGEFENASKISGEELTKNILIGREGCFACPIKCKRVVKSNDLYKVDPYYGGPEYETIAAFGSLCGISDLSVISKANELCNKYGLDTISTGVTIAFAMECFEKKIISKKDTDGVNLNFGNADAMLKILKLIIKREKIGDVLAEGVKRASDKFGAPSKEFAMHVKGQEVPLHDPRGKPGLALAYALSPTGADHMEAEHDPAFSNYSIALGDLSPLGILEPVSSLDFSVDKVRLFSNLQKLWNFYNSIGICDFVAVPGGYLTLGKIVELINAVTGWKTSWYELMKIGERANNMYRCFNMREGLSKKDDIIPERFFMPLRNGVLKGVKINRIDFKKNIKVYYEMQGWNQKGVPTFGKLSELNLEWIKI